MKTKEEIFEDELLAAKIGAASEHAKKQKDIAAIFDACYRSMETYAAQQVEQATKSKDEEIESLKVANHTMYKQIEEMKAPHFQMTFKRVEELKNHVKELESGLVTMIGIIKNAGNSSSFAYPSSEIPNLIKRAESIISKPA